MGANSDHVAFLQRAGIPCVDQKFVHNHVKFSFFVLEDPAYSTPGWIGLFFYFWALRSGYYVQQCIIFSTISGPYSLNLDWDIGPRSRFFKFFPFFSGYIVPGLFKKYHLKID
jgi:hypothetical protein